jgi:hypothetical protein
MRPHPDPAEEWLAAHPSPAVRYRARCWLQGLDPSDPGLRAELGGRPSPQAPVPCVTARITAYLATLGYAEDPHIADSVPRPTG